MFYCKPFCILCLLVFRLPFSFFFSSSSKVRWTMPQSTIDTFELLEQCEQLCQAEEKVELVTSLYMVDKPERRGMLGVFEEKQLHPEDEAELHTAFSFLL